MTYREWQKQVDAYFLLNKKPMRCIMFNESLMSEAFESGVSPSAFGRDIPSPSAEIESKVAEVKKIATITMVMVAAWLGWVTYHWINFHVFVLPDVLETLKRLTDR